MTAPADSTTPATRTIAVLLQDTPGSLDRALSAVRRQGCTVLSLAYGPSDRPGVARMTITVHGGNSDRLEQQLNRLVPVVAATDVSAAVRGCPPVTASAESIPFHHQADGASERGDAVPLITEN